MSMCHLNTHLICLWFIQYHSGPGLNPKFPGPGLYITTQVI